MTERSEHIIRSRYRKNKIFRSGVIALSALSVIPILLIIGEVFIKGIRQINLSFFTETAPDSFQAMAAVAGNEVIPGGIANGITGTLLIIIVSSLMAIPAGLMTGVFLAENRRSRYSDFIRNITEILQGVPSIVLGIIAYLWIVKHITNGFSAFAASVALAIMMLPMIVRSTEETMKMIPAEIREAAYALGTPYHRIILQVLIPSGFSGLSTGILLSLSRIIGETAPLMMTALGSSVININITKPVSAVPLLIWEFYNDPNMVRMVWSSSLFLMILVLTLNITSRTIASRNKSGRKR
ncbi:MAG TPA: phosphate ABC transporter permease PstA [Bacteroidales bacterium]|jgi:phosphate transport system permease protein|nr:phosphate ABC transporter permease PstA [Bacteroidales bacterium]